MNKGGQRRSMAISLALLGLAFLPGLPVTASAGTQSSAIKPGSYSRLAAGTTVNLQQLRGQLSAVGLRQSPPVIVKNPAGYAAVKAAGGRAGGAKTPKEMRAAVPAVSQGTVEEQLTVFLGMDLVQAFTALGPDQNIEPPDTHLAVGPTSIVETVNANMSAWSKSGTRLQVTDLNTFYAVPSGYSITDPRVLYDTASNRFIQSAVALDSLADSILELAVSQSSDPTAPWTRWQVKSTAKVLIDQPKVGTSDDKVTLSWAEAIPPPCQGQSVSYCFTGQFIEVLQKADLIASAAASVYKTTGDLGRFGIVPAQALSPGSTQYLVYNNADPYFLVENQCVQSPTAYYGSCPTLGEMWITGTPATHNIAIREVDPAILSTTVPANAPQLGSSTLINTGDDRLVSAVWQNDRLWTSATDGNYCGQVDPYPFNVTGSCLRMIQTATDQPGLPVLQDAILGTNNDYIYYPAVSMDSAGDLFVVSSRSNTGIYPGVWVQGKSLAANGWGPMSLLKGGNGPYDSTAGTCNGQNRWGDYSGAATDPTDPTDVWVAGEYAFYFNGNNTCTWGTAIGRLTYSAPTVTSVTAQTGPAGTSVVITGTDFVSSGTTVYFGANAATAVSVQTPNRLTATAPSGSGLVSLSASTADGQGPPGAQFKYPRIETGAPLVAPRAGGPNRGTAPPPVPPATAGPRPLIRGSSSLPSVVGLADSIRLIWSGLLMALRTLLR
jgi:hypothetical protein